MKDILLDKYKFNIRLSPPEVLNWFKQFLKLLCQAFAISVFRVSISIIFYIYDIITSEAEGRASFR